MLSSHPLPPEVLAGASLRRIFQETPPAPRASERGVRADPPSEARARVVSGRYRLLGYLESGGTADVYAALDLSNLRQVALKILRTEAAQSPVLRGLFLSGARAAMRIEHDSVVRVLEVRERRDMRPYAVMELLEGEALDALLQRSGALSPELALELARQAALGLEAAHRAGVVHCDIKPENLFVTAAGPLKILDFDLANVDRAPDASDGQLLRGTPKYMAPEQVVGDPVDERTDVYALGILLFCMLTGQLPFDLPLSATLLRHHLYSPLPPLSWLVDGIDPRLEALVARATRKDPTLRYPSMLALVADLDALAAGRALTPWILGSEADRYCPCSERGLENERALRSAA